MKQDDIIFALDIGTRTVVGLVIEYTGHGYKIMDSEVVEHEQRAMLDGQIHNVKEVARQVTKVKKNLEERLNIKLKKTAIAAAGRALKTITSTNSIEFDSKKIITSEDVKTLEFSAVQKAQEKLTVTGKSSLSDAYHFVGFSVIEYLLDGIYIGNLEGQSGKKIEVKIIATFLPQVVVDSLFNVINIAGLKADYLTLEPIAAANAVIPKDMYNFNIALVDIGAGTSDIALTRGGTMVGYDMVPVAGDEITEALAENFLLDYDSGEILKRLLIDIDSNKEIKVKNILSQEIHIKKVEAIKAIEPKVDELASLISQSILAINKKPPQVVILIGGGSLTPLLLEKLQENLGLESGRVGIKESTDIKNLSGDIKGITSAQAITPIGIALSSHQNKNRAKLLEVEVNNQIVQIFTVKKTTVADALLAAGVDFSKMNGRPGMGLACYLNGKLKVLKGTMGEEAEINLNGKYADLSTPIDSGDVIQYKPGRDGEDARGVIADLIPELKSFQIKVNGKEVKIKGQVFQNGKLVELNTPIVDGAEIEYIELNTIKEGIAQLYEISPEEITNNALTIWVNNKKLYLPEANILVLEKGELVNLDRPLKDGLNLKVIEKSRDVITVLDLCNKEKKDRISIFFNGSKLTIPIQKYRYYCNGELVGSDYVIKNGDQIKCELRPFRVKEVFNFINYDPSGLVENKFCLKINDQPAKLEDPVNEGDRLKITLDEA